jgi:cytochrome d ubiquinol oxidase subunit II
MDLNTLWFILIAVLFIGYFFLEGFDYGVGILLPFLAKQDQDRRVIINTVGPHWDGNEVWLVTAGGAIFAAFSQWYATLFSGFYLALVLMLIGLIVRGVAFEFRSKDANPKWRSFWDWMIFLGSFLPALLWGVALANILKGVPIDAHKNYVGGFFNLLNPYALLAGLTSLAGFMLHGAMFLALKTTDELKAKAQDMANKLWLPTVVLIMALVVSGYFATDVFARLGVNPGVAPLSAFGALMALGWFLRTGRYGWAFAMNGLGMALTVVSAFLGLYPRVMVSSLNPEWSLTIYNASSSPYTLTVMTIVALIFVPLVLLYQGWTYYVFRQRLGRQSKLTY